MTAKVTEEQAVDALAIMEVIAGRYVRESLPLRVKVGALEFRYYCLDLAKIAGPAYELVTHGYGAEGAFDYDFLPRWLEEMFYLDDQLSDPESLSNEVTPLLRTQLLEELA